MGAWPRAHRNIGYGIGIAFLVWKSPLATPLLTAWNDLGILPLARVIDYGDWAALLMLPLAAIRLQKMPSSKPSSPALPVAPWLALGLSVFAFCATSYQDEYDFTNQYELPISPAEAVQRLNALNAEKDLCNLPLSLHHTNANEFQQENNHRIYLHHNQSTETIYDTIYAQIEDSVFVDEIRSYELPAIDTMYVNPDGVFLYTFELRAKEHVDTLLQCQTVQAILKLVASGAGARLYLLHIGSLDCKALPENSPKSLEPADYLRSKFEAEVVAWLKER